MARKLIVEIVGDASSFQRSLQTAERSTQGFARKTTSMGSRLAKAGVFAGAAAGVGALGAAVKTGIEEFSEAQKVSAQTAAVLKSTGGVAGVTAGHVDKLAGTIQKYSGMDDEAIASGENLLLTFKNVQNQAGRGNDIFDQATTVMADMSTAMGQDMKSSAIQLGKALNDPVKGIGALSRVGVQFDSKQVQLIKDLIKGRKAIDNFGMSTVKMNATQVEAAAKLSKAGASWRDIADELNLHVTPAQAKLLNYWERGGHAIEAQKIVLKELNAQFAGSAKAAGETLAGKLNILKGTFQNLAGQIVGMVVPAFTKLVDRAVKWITNVQNQKKIMDTVRGVFQTVTHVLKILTGAFNVLSKIVGGNANAIKLLVAAYATFKILTIASSVTKLAGSFGVLAGRTGAATVATRGLTGAMLGKAGLVGAVGLLSFGLTTAILKATGLDQKFKSLGGSAYDLAAKIGLVNDQMAQYEGKAVPTQASTAQIKAQTERLVAGGATVSQAVARVGATHPGMATHDVQVLVRHFAEAFAKRGAGQTINIDTLHVSAQNPRDLQDALMKSHRGRPVRRRGDP